MISAEEVWDALSDSYGDSLRAVTRFEGSEFETEMRDDVIELYADTESRRVVDQVILDRLLSRDLESEFRCGELTGSIHIFEEALMVVQSEPHRRKCGFFVSFDRDRTSVGDLDSCLEYLRSEAV